MSPAIPSQDALFEKRAARRMLLGFCSALGIGAFFVVVCSKGFLPNSPLWSVFSAVPFTYFVMGSIETMIHRPYRDLATGWKTLKVSDRVLLGFLLFHCTLLVLVLSTASLLHLWLIAFVDH